jgi:hypothetical protein
VRLAQPHCTHLVLLGPVSQDEGDDNGPRAHLCPCCPLTRALLLELAQMMTSSRRAKLKRCPFLFVFRATLAVPAHSADLFTASLVVSCSRLSLSPFLLFPTRTPIS